MAHSNYYLDICAEAFIVEGDAVLLRLHEKYNIWTGPGGHIDPGEDPNEAVLREVWEEAGLQIELIGPSDWIKTDTPTNKDLVPPFFINRHPINDRHDHSALIFIARATSRVTDPQTEADKNAVFAWATKDELDQMLQNDNRLRPETYRYAIKALEIVRN